MAPAARLLLLLGPFSLLSLLNDARFPSARPWPQPPRFALLSIDDLLRPDQERPHLADLEAPPSPRSRLQRHARLADAQAIDEALLGRARATSIPRSHSLVWFEDGQARASLVNVSEELGKALDPVDGRRRWPGSRRAVPPALPWPPLAYAVAQSTAQIF